MTEENIAKIASNHVETGQSYKSYSTLCSFIGIEPKKGGKERKYQEKRLKCYFDWKKVEGSHKLIITETYYDNPKPYEDGRNGRKTTLTNGPMQQLLVLTDELYEEDYSKIFILKKTGIYRDRPEKIDSRRNTYYCYREKANSALESAVKQLNKSGPSTVTTYYSASNPSYRQLTSIEYSQYTRIYKQVLAQFGAKDLLDVERQELAPMFWGTVNSRSMKELQFSHVAHRFHFERNDGFSMDEYLNQLIIQMGFDEKEQQAVLSEHNYQEVIKSYVVDNMWDAFFKSIKRNGIGCVSDENYKKDFKEIRGFG